MKSKLILSAMVAIVLASARTALAQTSLLDPAFDPGSGAADGLIETTVAQPDGRVLVCGNFGSINGVPQAYIARLTSQGGVDPTFHAAPGYWVRHMALQADGKVVIGGFFTTVEGLPRKPGGPPQHRRQPRQVLRPRIRRGKEDRRRRRKDPFVFVVAVQPDGKILIGGNFATTTGSRAADWCGSIPTARRTRVFMSVRAPIAGCARWTHGQRANSRVRLVHQFR